MPFSSGSSRPRDSAGDLPDPRVEPRSPILQADSLQSELPGKPVEIYVLMKLLERLDVCF